jgi:hypothetical protein
MEGKGKDRRNVVEGHRRPHEKVHAEGCRFEG